MEKLNDMLSEAEWDELLEIERIPALADKVSLARGYAWGRQDATGHMDSFDAMRFAPAYGRRWRDYCAERVCYVPNVQSCYDTYRETGEVAR